MPKQLHPNPLPRPLLVMLKVSHIQYHHTQYNHHLVGCIGIGGAYLQGKLVGGGQELTCDAGPALAHVADGPAGSVQYQKIHQVPVGGEAADGLVVGVQYGEGVGREIPLAVYLAEGTAVGGLDRNGRGHEATGEGGNDFVSEPIKCEAEMRRAAVQEGFQQSVQQAHPVFDLTDEFVVAVVDPVAVFESEELRLLVDEVIAGGKEVGVRCRLHVVAFCACGPAKTHWFFSGNVAHSIRVDCCLKIFTGTCLCGGNSRRRGKYLSA